MREEKELFDQEKPVETMNWGKKALNMLAYAAIVIIASYLLVHFVIQRTVVSGGSMNPTLQDQDNVLVDKISYRLGKIERYDIVVFEVPYAKGTYYIKRIIGLPGETVQIQDGKVYINGELLDEHYGKEEIEHPQRAEEPITLGEDEYFVMGDNRNNSSDSRDPIVGNVKRSQIVGKAWIRIYPFSKIGILKHQ